MEEEGGDDSEMIDAMEGWDSDQDGDNKEDKTDATKSSKGKGLRRGLQLHLKRLTHLEVFETFK